MKLFIDTAFLDQIEEANSWGILDGVTTNPTHVSNTGQSPYKLYEAICKAVDGPVSLECLALDSKEIVAEARDLAAIAPNVVIKIPIIKDGLMAVKQLASEGIKTNVTVNFSASQALLAAKCGATYISPFVGRLDMIGHTGMDLIRQIRTIYQNYNFSTEILVAAVRTPTHILEAALIGADVCTMPLEMMRQMYDHPMTDAAIQQFLADWEKVPRETPAA